ncbi:tetratricopeptide repeat protein [Lacinutrix iliipiscaria]|uniref:Tetratricopeptide repeat protein n=1 Tax=Lacinutrix iliipiscaria TaxID=1230532 RepID=A0ABW5WMA8_9FLAO
MKTFFAFLLFPMLCLSQTPLDQAEQLLQQKKYVEAEQLLSSYVTDNPNNLKALEFYGDAFGYQEKWDFAIVQYKKLVKASPKEANYHYKYGGALAMKTLQVNKLKALTLIGDVKEAFLTAAQLDKNHINTRWALVELYMQLPGIIGGSQSTSLKYANELEALSKVDGYLAKGYIYEYDDEPELAEIYYKKAITEGGSITCFEKLSNFYENTNAPEKALATIEASQAKHQRNALHYQIGKIAAEYNIQLAKGTKCLITYIKNYSAEDGVPIAWAHYRLAQIYKHQNHKAKALKHINLALSERPQITVFKTEKERILSL